MEAVSTKNQYLQEDVLDSAVMYMIVKVTMSLSLTINKSFITSGIVEVIDEESSIWRLCLGNWS